MKQNQIEYYIRPAAFAGPSGFYPSDPERLRQQIQRYLDESEVVGDEAPWGLVAPHAGYVYSGPVAAWAYRQIVGRDYDAVIVLAPSHREPFGYASVMTRGSYVTPLGEMTVAERVAEELVASAGKAAEASLKGHATAGAFSGEHSLEVHLPFLQVALGNIPIVPVVLGWVGWEACRNLGRALAVVSERRKLLVVASSDLSHYHSYEEAYRLDKRVVATIEALDAQGLAEGCREGRLEACGGMPIAAMLAAAREMGGANVRIFRHKNSGDVPEGGKEQVVGYLAAGVYVEKKNMPKPGSHSRNFVAKRPIPGQQAARGTPPVHGQQAARGTPTEAGSGSGLVLNQEDKATLLKRARETIALALNNKSSPRAEFKGNLREKRGVFVTLRIAGRLRGCIGRLTPDEPLGMLVGEVAVQSALSDPRFPPLEPEELALTEVEITVLGEIEAARAEDVVPGRHGLLIRKGWQQGLLLPQVATEHGWGREEFLDATCRKAGLPAGCWREKETKIFIFTADVF